MRPETMIAVQDVEKSSAWYQTVLGCVSTHGGNEFDRLQDGETVLLLLHHRNAEEHGFVRAVGSGQVGAGVCLVFRVEDLDSAYARAREAGVEIVEPPHENPLAGQRELELRDPDGYFVTLCQ